MDFHLINNIVHGDVDYCDTSIMNRIPYRHRRSPVMVTIADSKISSVDLQKLIELGVNVIKLKSLLHLGEYIKLLGYVDKAMLFLSKKHAELDWPVCTCMEIKTSTVKTGTLEGAETSITLTEGQKCTLTCNPELFDKCNSNTIYVDNPHLGEDVKGNVHLTASKNEMSVEFRCIKVIDDVSILCAVTKSGELSSMCNVMIEAVESTPHLTTRDLENIKFALEYQMDMIFIDYVTTPNIIVEVKRFIKTFGKKIKQPLLLTEVCCVTDLHNIDEIIKESDGIVFPRNHLIYELEESKRFRLLHIQKVIGAKCQQAGKPFYISGGVFKQALSIGKFVDSETSEITNDIIDGATGFILDHCADVNMLHATVRAMNDLCCTVEPMTNTKTDFWRIIETMPMPVTAAEACAVSCAAVAHQTRARIIVMPTVSGATVGILLWLQPAALIITVSTQPATAKRLKACRNVVPLLFKGEKYKNWYRSVSARVEFAVEYAVKKAWIKRGDGFVTLQRGSEDSAFSDTVKIWNVTISQKTLVECPSESDAMKQRLD